MIKFNGQLTFLNDNGTNGAVLKWFTESLTIGSDEGCDCCINCNSISPNHCILRLDNEKHAFLTHIGSDKYKTYLEGKEVKSSSILNHNCVFTLGTRSFRFQYPTMSIWHSDNLKVGKSPVVSHKKLQRPPVVSTPKNPTYSVLCHETNSPTISPITISNTKISTIIPVKRLNVRPFITPIQNKMIDKNKRKSKINLSLMKSDELRRHVSFGPNLSPEQFDKELPPIQPLKKGATPMKSLVDVESSEDENESPAHKDKSLRRNYSVISREASLGKSPTDKTYSSPSESDDINDSFTDKVLAKNRLSTSDSSINLPKRTSSSIKKTIDLYEYSVENENTISKNLTKSGKSISKSHILENLNDDVIDQSSQCDKDFSRNETMDLGNIKQLESEQINKMSKMVIKNNTDNNNEMSSNLSAFKKLIRLSRISNTNLPMELLNPVSKINKVEFKRGRKLKKKALKSDNDTKKDIIKDRQSICMEGITELFDINEEELNNSLSKSRKSRGNSLNKQITSNGKISRSSSKSSERNSRITRTSKKLKGEIFDGINRKSLNSNESNNDQNSNKRKSRLSRKSKHVGSSSDLKEISHGDSSNKVLFSESHNEIEPMSAGDNQESEIECEGQILRNSIASRKSRKSIIHSNNNSVKELKKSIKKSSIRKSNISRHSSKILQSSSEIDSEANEKELVKTGRKSKKISQEIKNNRKSNKTLSEEIDDNELSAPNRKSRLSRKSWNIGSLFNDSKRSIINSTLENDNEFDNNQLSAPNRKSRLSRKSKHVESLLESKEISHGENSDKVLFSESHSENESTSEDDNLESEMEDKSQVLRNSIASRKSRKSIKHINDNSAAELLEPKVTSSIRKSRISRYSSKILRNSAKMNSEASNKELIEIGRKSNEIFEDIKNSRKSVNKSNNEILNELEDNQISLSNRKSRLSRRSSVVSNPSGLEEISHVESSDKVLLGKSHSESVLKSGNNLQSPSDNVVSEEFENENIFTSNRKLLLSSKSSINENPLKLKEMSLCESSDRPMLTKSDSEDDSADNNLGSEIEDKSRNLRKSVANRKSEKSITRSSSSSEVLNTKKMNLSRKSKNSRNSSKISQNSLEIESEANEKELIAIERKSIKIIDEIKNNRKSLNQSNNIISEEFDNRISASNRKSRLSRKSKNVESPMELKELSHAECLDKVLFSESHSENESTNADDNLESEIEDKSQVLRNSIASRKSRKSIIHSNSNSVKELENSIKKSSIRKSNISRHSSKISQNSSEIDSESNELVTTGRKSNKISKKIKNNRKSNNTLSEEIDDNEVSAPNRKSRLSRKSWNIGSLFNDSKRSIINSTLEKEKLNTFESNTETCLNVSPEKSSLEDSTNNPLQKINIDYEDSPSKERNNSTSTNVQYEISDDNNFSQLNVNKMSLRKSNTPKNYVEIRKSKKYDFQHSISFLNKKSRKSTPVNDKIINKSFEINKDEDTQTSINEPNLSGVEQNNIEITTSSRKSNINRKSKSSIKISDINLSNKFETNNLSVNEELNKSENDTFILHSRKSRKSSVERKLSKIELEKVRATKSLSNGNSRRQPNSRKISLNDVQFQPQTSLLITSDTIELNKSKLSLNDNSEKFKLRKSVSPEQFLDYEENINKISPVITNSKVTENFDERVVDKSELNVSSYSQMSIDNNSIGKLSINKEIRNSLDSEHDVNISILSQKYSIGRKSRKSDKIKQSALRKSEHNQTSRKSNNSYAIQSEAISESLQYNTDSKDTPNSLKSTVSRKSVIDEKTSISIDVAKNSDEQPMSSRKSIFNKKSSVDLMTNSSISDSTRIRISNSNHPNDSTEVDKNISVNSATEYELNENTSILNDSKQSKKIKGKNSYGISDMSSGNINVDINKSYNEKLIIEGESQENVNFVSQSKESENIKDLVKLQRNVESMITQSNAIKKPVRNKRAIDKDLHASNQPPSKRILRHIVESVSENRTENNSTSRTRLKRLLESSDIDKKSNTTLTDTHDSIVEVIPVKTRGRPKKKEIKPFIENEDVDNIDSTQLNLNSKNNLLSFDNILSKTSGEVKKNTENFGENNIDMISQETFNEINLNTINAVVKKPRGRAKKIPESVAVSNDENVDKSVLNTNDNLYQGNKLKKTRGRTKNVKDEYSSEYLENFPAIQKITRGKAKKLVHIEYNQNEDSKSIDQNLTKTRGKAKAVEIRKIDSNSLPDINVSESVGILNFEDSNSPLTIRGRRKKVIIPEQENLLVNEVDNIQNIKRTRGRKIVENSNELIHENSQNEVNNIQSTKRTRGRKIVEISNNELIHENPQNEVDNIQNTKRTRGRKIVEISNELIQENSQNVVEFKKPSLRNRKNNNVNDPSNSETSSVIDTEQELKARKGRKRKNEIDSINSETSVIKLVKEGSITRGRRKLQIDTINNSDKENENKENEKKSNSKKRIQSENVEEYNEIVHVVPAKVLRKSILSETNTNTENQVNEPSRMETRKRRGKK